MKISTRKTSVERSSLFSMSAEKRQLKFPALRNIAAAILISSAVGVSSGQESVTVRPELNKPLSGLQEALKQQQPVQALKFLQEARAVPQLSPAEQVLIERFGVATAAMARDDEAARSSLEFLIRSPDLEASDRLNYLETLTKVAQRLRKIDLVASTARKYLDEGGNNPAVRTALIQSYSAQGRHEDIIKFAEPLLTVSGPTRLTELELRLLAASYHQRKNNIGYYNALKALVSINPKPIYWEDLASNISIQPFFQKRYELDAALLLEEVGGIKDVDDVISAANAALISGFPSLSLRFIESGFSNGVIDKNSNSKDIARLKAEATKRATEDEKAFVALQKNASNASAQSEIAEILASKQQWAPANEAFANALAKGGLKREPQIRLRYGLSLYKAGKLDAARELFRSVADDQNAQELANLWLMRISKN